MITPAYSPTATERVLPRMALDFTTAVLDSRVTVTRALNTATAINSSGFVAIVNANLPRFDYDPSTLQCKGLLIEEARSNLLLQSSNFSTSWVTDVGSCTVTSDDDISPDGTQNADKLAFVGTNANRYQTVAGLTIGASYTMTVWLRVASGTASVSIGNINAGVNVAQTVTTTWQRFTVTQTASATTRYPQITATNVDVFAWGAQLEAGAFATSYIPTTTTSLTRNADVVSMTGTNFSDWYNQAAGAFAVSFDRIAAVSASFSGGQPRTLRVVNAAVTDFFILGGNSSFGEQLIGRASGVDTVSIQTGVQITANTVATECFGYAVNNFALSVNGASAQTDVSGANPATMDVLHIGDGVTATRNINGHVRKISYWPQRITNAEVQAFSKG
jgi:hypothetical protein